MFLLLDIISLSLVRLPFSWPSLLFYQLWLKVSYFQLTGNYDIARTFLKAGCNIRQESWLYSGANIEMNRENVALLKEIREKNENPASLKSLTRSTIRTVIKKTAVVKKIDSLPLPRQLKEYLLFHDLFWPRHTLRPISKIIVFKRYFHTTNLLAPVPYFRILLSRCLVV